MNESERLWEWDDFIRFQQKIAVRWFIRGNKAGDSYSKFFFFFSGFNALYFLWRKVDNVKEGSEGKHIEHLLTKFRESEAKEILASIKASVAYFVQRNPIQRMDKRNKTSPYEGNIDEGRKWRNKLTDVNSSNLEKIVALGNILYLVRSNLVHGSKAGSGDDRRIIEMSINPLKILLEKSIILTENLSPWKKMT